MATATKRKATKRKVIAKATSNGHANIATPEIDKKESARYDGIRQHLESILKSAGRDGIARNDVHVELAKLMPEIDANNPPSAIQYHLGIITKSGRATAQRINGGKYHYFWAGSNAGRPTGSKNVENAVREVDLRVREPRRDPREHELTKRMLLMQLDTLRKLIEEL